MGGRGYLEGEWVPADDGKDGKGSGVKGWHGMKEFVAQIQKFKK